MTDKQLSPEAQAVLDAYLNAPMPTPLSPAAQAVLDAAFDTDFEIDLANLDATFEASINKIVVAALRAIADQVVPDIRAFISPGTAAGIRDDIFAIATELEGRP